MRITTVIPAFNCKNYLPRAVESILATTEPDLEIVIVDDGSTDGTRELASELAASRPDCIRTYTHPNHANCGVSASRNLGLRFATGDLIAFLDADDFVYPWRFESSRQIFVDFPHVDAVYQTCHMNFEDEHARSSWWDEKPVFGLDRAIHDRRELLESLLNACTWHTGAIVCRRRLIDRVGGFDPTMTIAEDCHMWLRMAYASHVVPGDLSRPVSVYVRRGGSAYQPHRSHRIKVVRAVAAFYQWARKFDDDTLLHAHIQNATADYICRGLENLRADGRSLEAAVFAVQSLTYLPEIAQYRRFWGNTARIPFGARPARSIAGPVSNRAS